MKNKKPADSSLPPPANFKYPFIRRKTRQIRIGRVAIGGQAPVVVQSMTKTDTRDKKATNRY